MTASWAAVLAAIAAQGAGSAVMIWRTGRWTGGVNAVLDELRRITGDHENRLRSVEREPGAHARRR